jgi:hypothetical protein
VAGLMHHDQARQGREYTNSGCFEQSSHCGDCLPGACPGAVGWARLREGGAAKDQ